MFSRPEMRLDVVSAAQSRTTAAELGLSTADPLDELESLPQRIQFLNDLVAGVGQWKLW